MRKDTPVSTFDVWLHHSIYKCNGCNMGTRDLPDMYAQSPRATGPRAEGIHIRQITRAHVTSNMYHF